MRHRLATFLLLVLTAPAFAGTEFKATTTLAAETANNTSAADSFAGQSNGNVAATNISKVPIRNLLYPGSTTKIYAHMMPWFGGTNHVSVGYDSTSPTQAARQVNDMVSRGIDGMIIDWYGPTYSRENTSSLNLLAASQNVPNFEVALMEDVGAIRSASNPTAKLISDMNYAWTNFMQSPVYMRRNGRPVVFFFGVETLGIDLVSVKAQLAWNPIFIFENTSAYSLASSDGAFSWVAPVTTNYANYTGLNYLNDFYWNAVRNPAKMTFGSGFKGFDDTPASWAPPGGRHVLQFCGQTWLNSMALAGSYYSTTNQLANLQLVTWNDYEEGTALEPGIDNCLSISASVSGNTLNWAITGQENTLDHYQIFISQDGVNLMPLTTVPTGLSSHDLGQYGFAAGTYSVFVQAVGKPSIVNHMSAPASFSVAATPTPTPDPQPTPTPSQPDPVPTPTPTDPNPTPTDPTPTPSDPAPVQTPTPTPVASDFAVTAGSAKVSLKRGSSATMSLSVAGVSGAFDKAVNFTCSGLPAGMTCNFAPAAVTPGSGAAASVLTLSMAQQSARNQRPFGLGLADTMFCLMGAAVFGRFSRKGERARKVCGILIAVALVASLGAMIGCGGGASTTTPPVVTQPSAPSQVTYSIQILSTSGTTQHASSLTVTVN